MSITVVLECLIVFHNTSVRGDEDIIRERKFKCRSIKIRSFHSF